MARIREWIDRLLGTLRRQRSDADLEAELRSHLELAAELEGRTTVPAITHAMDRLRDRRGIPWLHALSADVVFGWRQLNRHRVVTAAAILSLGLAIGATSAAFRLVDAVLLRPLPIAEPDRLSYAATRMLDAQGRLDYRDGWDYPTYRRYRELVGDRADLLVVGSSSRVEATIGQAEDVEQLNRQYFSGNVFGIFGLQPALGRLLGPADDRAPGAHPVAVIAHELWTRRFGADPRVLGTKLRIGTQVYEVVGVAPRGFTGTEPGRSADLFLPALMNVEALEAPGWEWFQLWVRARPGATLAAVGEILNADLDRRRQEEMRQLPPDTPRERLDRMRAERIDFLPAASGASALKQNFRRPLAVLAALVGLLLLIACANVANLLNAQALARGREMALRVSIGAGRWRLVRLMLVESALIAVLATALGAAFAWWAAPFVVSMLAMPEDPVRLAMGIDWRTVSFGIVLASSVTALFGLTPALRASAVAPVDALKGGGRSTRARRLTQTLVGAQAAFCVFVLFVAVLLGATFARLATAPLGFDAERLLVASAEARRSPDGAERWRQLADELRSRPGIESVALAGWPLLSGNRWRWDVRASGRTPSESAHFLSVSPGFLETMRIPLLAGRDVRAGEVQPGFRDGAGAIDGVGLVNQAFARAYFDGRSPVGERVGVAVRPNTYASLVIVGLTGDAAYTELRDPIRPTVYVPIDPVGGATLVIRTTADPSPLIAGLRRDVLRARPDARLRLVAPQTALVRRQLIRERLLASLSGFIAAVALLLAGIGLYGVLHHAVTLQQRQIGIRMALGARAAQVVREVTAGTLGVVAVGALAGLAGGLAFGRVIERLLFGVGATDALAVAIPLLVLAGASVLAALPPAVRAARLDPALTLRAE